MTQKQNCDTHSKCLPSSELSSLIVLKLSNVESNYLPFYRDSKYTKNDRSSTKTSMRRVAGQRYSIQ